MAIPLSGPLPPGLELTGAYVIQLTALDPLTGLTVSGVTVSLATYQVDPLTDVTPAVLIQNQDVLVPGPGE